jgi:Protein of unknown function (DUF1580)
MSIEKKCETPIPLSDVVKMMPSGRRLDFSTVWRWCMGNGVKGVHLEHSREGGRLYTTVEAVERFRQKVKRASKKQLQKSS